MISHIFDLYELLLPTTLCTLFWNFKMCQKVRKQYLFQKIDPFEFLRQKSTQFQTQNYFWTTLVHLVQCVLTICIYRCVFGEPVFYGSPEIEGGKKVQRGTGETRTKAVDLNGVQKFADNSSKSPASLLLSHWPQSLLNRKIIWM